ncbi:NUDIX hydrolase [Christensenellaceae bacterium OttesenSCG-928-M15]|nr:NUDIX hydrolase [Christensenellaceae bacterium OttesenSCG-928-M15]
MRNEKGQTLEAFLSAYNPGAYERPSVTADIAVFTLLDGPDVNLGILLIKRKDHPFIGQWALPGGFLDVKQDQDLMAAAGRELLEETGVKGLALRQFHTFSDMHRDPRTRIITSGYVSVVPAGLLKPKAADDAADEGIFKINAYTHRDVITLALSGKETYKTDAKLYEDALGPNIMAVSRENTAEEKKLASDHGFVIHKALQYLMSLDTDRLCAALCGEKGMLYAQTKRMLNEVKSLYYRA